MDEQEARKNKTVEELISEVLHKLIDIVVKVYKGRSEKTKAGQEDNEKNKDTRNTE